MKIEKLYTLSQFVDKIKTDLNPKGYNGNKSQWTQLYFKVAEPIFNYNDFLNQPLTKDMFVNLYDKPNKRDFYNEMTDEFWSEIYNESLEQWEEAEKKVIFKNVELINDEYAFNCIVNDSWQILIWEKPNVITLNSTGNKITKTSYINSLHNLAEATNGELPCEFEI